MHRKRGRGDFWENEQKISYLWRKEDVVHSDLVMVATSVRKKWYDSTIQNFELSSSLKKESQRLRLPSANESVQPTVVPNRKKLYAFLFMVQFVMFWFGLLIGFNRAHTSIIRLVSLDFRQTFWNQCKSGERIRPRMLPAEGKSAHGRCVWLRDPTEKFR